MGLSLFKIILSCLHCPIRERNFAESLQCLLSLLCIFSEMSRNCRSVSATEAHTKKKEYVALYLVFTESTVSRLQVAVPMP